MISHDTAAIIVLERQNAARHIAELEQARLDIAKAYDGFYTVMKLTADYLCIRCSNKRYINPHDNGLEDIYSDMLLVIDDEIETIKGAL